MATAEMTLNELRSRGYEALVRELGPIGYVRFIQQFATGRGDFTVDRRSFINHLTSHKLCRLIEQQRRGDQGTQKLLSTL